MCSRQINNDTDINPGDVLMFSRENNISHFLVDKIINDNYELISIEVNTEEIPEKYRVCFTINRVSLNQKYDII